MGETVCIDRVTSIASFLCVIFHGSRISDLGTERQEAIISSSSKHMCPCTSNGLVAALDQTCVAKLTGESPSVQSSGED